MEDKPLVLMTHDLPPDWVENSLNDFRVILGDNDQRGIDNKLKKYLPEASGIICLLDDPIPATIINQAPLLKVISNMAVGTDNIDVKTCTSRGIPVGHTPGVLTDGTADLTLALLLSVSRQLAASKSGCQGWKMVKLGTNRMARQGSKRRDGWHYRIRKDRLCCCRKIKTFWM